MPRRLLVATLLTLVGPWSGWLVAVHAQSGEYKIGVLEPLTGPLAGEGKRHSKASRSCATSSTSAAA
jgi:hypothetical protein